MRRATACPAVKSTKQSNMRRLVVDDSVKMPESFVQSINQSNMHRLGVDDSVKMTGSLIQPTYLFGHPWTHGKGPKVLHVVTTTLLLIHTHIHTYIHDDGDDDH